MSTPIKFAIVEFELVRWTQVRLRGATTVDSGTRCPVHTPESHLAVLHFLRGKKYLKREDLFQDDWNLLSLSGYNSFVNRTKEIPDVRVLPLPLWLLDLQFTAMNPNSRTHTSTTHKGLTPETIRRRFPQLYDYQVEGVFTFFKNQQKLLLADSMGLGKTAQACVCAQLSDAVNVLVVCPAILRRNWESELSYWKRADAEKKPSQEKDEEKAYEIMKNGTCDPTGRDIVSYSILHKVVNKMCSLYDFIIVDESHFTKNEKSLRTKAFRRLIQSCPKAGLIMLSGTPMCRPWELYVSLKSLLPFNHHQSPKSFSQLFPYKGKFNPDVVGGSVQESFGARYCQPKQVYVNRHLTNINLDGTDRQEELKLLMSRVVLRRRKQDVLKNLPPKVCHTVRLEGATASEIRKFKRTLDTLEKVTEKQGKRAADVILNRLVMETADIKIRSVLPHWIKEKLVPVLSSSDCSEKYLCFARHHTMLDFLAQTMSEHNIGFVAIDGRTKIEDRQRHVNSFRDDENVKVAVLGIQSAGTGLNFQTATQVVFFELSWSEKDIRQAEDRAHRIGVPGTVFVHYLCLEGSTDDLMLGSVFRKTKTAAEFLDDRAKKRKKKDEQEDSSDQTGFDARDAEKKRKKEQE